MIPRILHQTCADPARLPPEALANLEATRQLHPGWSHRLYDDRQVRAYLQRHLDAESAGWVRRINPDYGVVLADLFRYLVVYLEGGVYLDIKSAVLQPLDASLRPQDEYLLAQWRNRPGEEFAGWGLHPELQHVPGGEFQQWHVIAAPRHPFLLQVIRQMLANLRDYDAQRRGVGRRAVLRLSGPICYTLAIFPLLQRHPARLVDSAALGLRYSYHRGPGWRMRHMRAPGHYSRQTGPLVLPP